MLYEMAKRHDVWPGEDYSGSSCRGAIQGWYNTGVCRDASWKYVAKRPGHLTVTRAKEARSNTIGAYYRIKKNIVDMHAALNEVGALYVSAKVHQGWQRPTGGEISYSTNAKMLGGHAFAVVGYNDKGFWVQNSWGPSWGKSGLALWLYEDWKDNVKDAWVVQLALPTPQLYSRRSVGSGVTGGSQVGVSSSVRRDEIAGHFVHIDDGQFHTNGKYWSDLQDVRETARLVAQSNHYKHLMIYAHGGLNSVKASANRIASMKDTFLKNGIYPYHFMYDTGLLEEIKDIVLGKKAESEERTAGFTDWTDWLIEKATHRLGRAVWREMKQDAHGAFRRQTSPGTLVLKEFVKAFKKTGKSLNIHVVGHSTGCILAGHLLDALCGVGAKVPRIKTTSLMAPATTIDFFKASLLPHLRATGFGVDTMKIYNLIDELEKDDNVAKVYRKSLLYLVSKAFEEESAAPILGMQRYSKGIEKAKPGKLEVLYSKGSDSASAKTSSTSHGGFDNDPNTMNSVLKTILGTAPGHPFTKEILNY